MKLLVALLGKIDYLEALAMQEKLLILRQSNKIEDTLLLLEHFPVLTVGLRNNRSNIIISEEQLVKQGVNIYDVKRGGDVTYHGPGQIVGYPILDLNLHGRDVHLFLRKVEETFIQLLKKEFEISAGRDSKYPGVWVDNEKITAIGCALKRWVTMHGFAFNVNTQLEHFSWITPCGIIDKGVTSLEKLFGFPQDIDKVYEQVISYFSKVFDLEPEIIDKQEINRIIREIDVNG